ncbi:unnamed protein product [Thelazia callipaeda]|uniref:Glycoprotein n=1 Tax=Thelazia callipaeda TaxID=103827 RepID=A0A158RBV9_THECL|nr:unnamed protein product [Thelazia callipaeda]
MRMLVLLFLLLEAQLYDCSEKDTTLVINRINNRVEFSDLLLEYNHNQADENIVNVNISFMIHSVVSIFPITRLKCEIFQQWRDSRLKYFGTSSITVIPKGTKIWIPDTNFVNSEINYGLQSSLRLHFDGLISWKQQARLTIPCFPKIYSEEVKSKSDAKQSISNCSLIIASFDNAGAESIVYTLDKVIHSLEDPAYFGQIENYTIMEVNNILLPLISEFRKRSVDNSLLVMFDSVELCTQYNESKCGRKTSKKAIDQISTLELVEVFLETCTVQAYMGEVHHWQTKPCRNLNKIVSNMIEIDNLRMISKGITQKVSAWRRINDEKLRTVDSEVMICFTLNDSYFANNIEIVTFLEYSLQTLCGFKMQMSVEKIKQVVLPTMIGPELWISIMRSEVLGINMELFDYYGIECGFVRGIHLSESCLQRFQRLLEEPTKSSKQNMSGHQCVVAKRLNQGSVQENVLDVCNFHYENMHDISESTQEVMIDPSVKDKVRKTVESIAKTSCRDDHMSFLSFGFDSLKLARLEFMLQTKFSEEFFIPYGSAHQYSTINALSEYISKNLKQENSTLSIFKFSANIEFLNKKLRNIIKSGEEIPLCSVQKRIVFLSQLYSERKFSFIETLKFSIGTLQVIQFQNAFNRIIARHTALRTIYTTSGQTVLSLTEANFSIFLRPDRVFHPIDLFDSEVPIRIMIAAREKADKQENQKVGRDLDKTHQYHNIQYAKDEQKETFEIFRITVQLHHIMIDGLSIKLLSHELRELYDEKTVLKPLQYQYTHYMLLEHQRKQDSEDRRSREDFWKRLVSQVELQQLPTKKAILQSENLYKSHKLVFTVDSRTEECLRNLAIRCNVTQFSVLVSNFQLLQYNLYGFRDTCTGITVTLREIPELCTVIGCLLNVVPVINSIDPTDQIYNALMKSYQQMNKSIHKQMPFDDLITTLQVPRDGSNSPLFQVLFILDDQSSDDIEHDKCNGDNDDKNAEQNLDIFSSDDSNFAQYDQVWYFCYKKKITIKIEYNGHYFDESMIKAYLYQYIRLIHRVSQNLYISVENIELISSEEKFNIYQQMKDNRCDFPIRSTVLNMITEQNRIDPCCNVIIENGLLFSSIFLQRTSNQLSRLLEQKLLQFWGESMRSDHFVMLIFDRSVYLIVMIYALWKCGIAALPVNSEISLDHLHKILGKVHLPTVIYDNSVKYGRDLDENDLNESWEKLRKVKHEASAYAYPVFKQEINELVTSCLDYSDQEIRKKITQYNLAYLTFTSGSTGNPKEICTEFLGLSNLAFNYAEMLSLNSNSVIYQIVNPSFDIFFADLLEAQTNGASLQLASQRIPNINEMSKVTHAYIMPAYLSAIPTQEWERLKYLQKINFGGDYIQDKTLRDAIQAGYSFYNQYGATESSIFSTCHLMKVCNERNFVGKALKNVHLLVRNNNKHLCERRTPGTCCISGTGVARGYYDNEHLNQVTFLHNHDLTRFELLLNNDNRYFWTGDLVEMRNNTGGLLFYGRKDFQVKIRGMKVDIGQIEIILGQHPAVRNSIVCLQKNNESDEILTAYVQLFQDKQANKASITKCLLQYLSTKLPSYMIPKQYKILQEFPVNANGKIDRKRLPIPETFMNSESSPSFGYTLEFWERQVIDIFVQLLPDKVIELEKSFFEVGGDSLKALIAIQNIKSETGMALELQKIFELSSFKAILQYLRQKYIINNSGENTQKYSIRSRTVEVCSASEISNSTQTKSTEPAHFLPNKNKLDTCTISGKMKIQSIPVSLQQKRLLFLYSFSEKYRECYKLRFDIIFYGRLNYRFLNTAINYVMRKHQILRTIFLQKGANIVQEVTSLTECYINICSKKFGTAEIDPSVKSKTNQRVNALYDNPLVTINFSRDQKLTLIFDHLIVDGRSIAILTKDFVDFYNRLLDEDNIFPNISDLSNTYAEFCSRQQKQLENLERVLKSDASLAFVYDEKISSHSVENNLREFRSLEGLICKLRDFSPNLFTGDLSDANTNIKSQTIRIKLPQNLDSVKSFCVEHECTLFAYLLCNFALTIRHLFAAKKFAVVSAALNRAKDTIDCVGLFANNVIIPIDTNFENISEFIHNIQQNIAESLQFQHIPYEYIIQRLNPKRSIDGSEIYQISFVLHNASAMQLPKINGVKAIVQEINANYAKFEQTWSYTEFSEYIEMVVEYRSAKYSTSMMQKMMQVYEDMASIVLKHESSGVKDILQYSKIIREEVFQKNQKLKERKELKGGSKQQCQLERILLEIWKKILNNPNVTIFDNFFAKGGHSLLIANICYHIKEQIDFECSPQIIFRYQTIQELAKYIQRKQNQKLSKVFPRKFEVPVCPLQESLAIMFYNETKKSKTSSFPLVHSKNDLARAYQTGFSICLENVNLLRLKYTLNLIILRHCALRTTFYCQNRKFFQEIHSGSEVYVAPRKITSEFPENMPLNPFDMVPILCWLNDTKDQSKKNDQFELHFRISHAACDGKSLNILAKEFHCIYLHDFELDYKSDNFLEFSKRIQQRFSKRRTEVSKYWSKILKGSQALNFYYDKVIGNTASGNKCKFICKTFSKLYKITRKIANKCGCSPFTIQMAAFSKVISMRTDQAFEVLIACPFDMRDCEVIGMCINVLPILIDVGERTYQNLIQNVAKCLTDAYVNADISSVEIEKICTKHGISNFIQVMIVDSLDETFSKNYQFLNNDSEYTKCALTLFLTPRDEDTVAKIEFKQDLFYNESMNAMLNCWAKTIGKMESIIVNGIKEADGRNVKLDERQSHFHENNSKEEMNRNKDRNSEFNISATVKRKSDYPKFSLQQLISDAFENNSKSAINSAVIGSDEKVDYTTLRERMLTISRVLQQKVIQITGRALRADDVIAIIASNSIETLIICYAVILAGAAYLPIDCMNPMKRISKVLDQINAAFYVVIKNKLTFNEAFPNLSKSYSFQNAVELQLTDSHIAKNYYMSYRHFKTLPLDLAYVIFTSGTTGKPKGVAINQNGLLNMAVACTQNFWMKSEDCVYQFTNFAFDNSVLEVIMAFVNGASLLLRDNFFTPDKFLNELKSFRISHALLFPGLVECFTTEQIRDLRHLRYWIVGAESINNRLLEFALKSGVNIIQNYGPTETTAYALSKRMKLLDKANNIGQGILNTEITVRDSQGEALTSAFAVGELAITGEGVMRGYISTSTDSCSKMINRRSERSQRFSFNTKDLVRLQTNDDIIFLGRSDEQIKIRGIRVELGEIENILCKHSDVKSAKVILTKDQQQLAAFIIPSSTRNELKWSTLRNFLLQYLPYYMVPIRFHSLHQLPLTRNSKIDVEALKALLHVEDKSVIVEDLEVENRLQAELLVLFREVLQNSCITTQDDFFAFGGNSFSASKLVQMIQNKLTYHVDTSDVFHYRNVKRLSVYIASESLNKPKSSKVDKISDSYNEKKPLFDFNNIPLSFQQQQFRFLNETKQRQCYELIYIQKFHVSLSFHHLKLAFLRLILRQPSLRTFFPERNFEAYQEILSGTEAYFHSSILQCNFPSTNADSYIAEKVETLRNSEILFTDTSPILCTFLVVSNMSYVILRINHIIIDAWSTGILENDLTDLYQKVLKNNLFDISSKLHFTYAEYSIEQQQQNNLLEKLANAYADKIMKWIAKKQDCNQIYKNWKCTDISAECSSQKSDEPLKIEDSGLYFETRFTVDIAKVQNISHHFGVTPLVVFLSSFTLALHEISATNQLIISIPIANRTLKTNQIIGNFLNNLLVQSEHDRVVTVDEGISNENEVNVKNSVDFERKEYSQSHLKLIKKHISNISAAVNEVRQFEQIPFVILFKAIRSKLKKFDPASLEMLDRLHKTVFFNFRYGLEDNRECILGEGEVHAPPDCIHEIEVEVDQSEKRYLCRLRMQNRQSKKKHLLQLHQRMVALLEKTLISHEVQRQISEIIKNKSIDNNSSLYFAQSPEIKETDSALRRIWAECLNKKTISDEDNFFLEGGNSMLTLKLKRQIQAEFNIPIEIEEIFKNSHFTHMRCLISQRLHDKHRNFLPENSIKTNQSVHEGCKNLILASTLNQDFAAKATDLHRFEDKNAVHVFYQNESNATGDIIVFFHALIGGVTVTYAPIVRQMLLKHSRPFKIIGIEHPDTFSYGYLRNPNLYRSIESLCSKYVQDMRTHLCKNRKTIFIGASFGAVLAYQCANELDQQEAGILQMCAIHCKIPILCRFFISGIRVNQLISIDGVACWNSTEQMPSYKQHRSQIMKFIKIRTGQMEINSKMKEAMIDNAWELLKMMRIYSPRSLKDPSSLHITLLKSNVRSSLHDDYGWTQLCDTTVISIPFSHETMFDDGTAVMITDIIIESIARNR